MPSTIYRTHERRHTEDTKTLKCTMCSAKFEHKFYLNQHMQKKHQIENLAQIPSCLTNSRKWGDSIKYRCLGSIRIYGKKSVFWIIIFIFQLKKWLYVYSVDLMLWKKCSDLNKIKWNQRIIVKSREKKQNKFDA